MVKVGIETLALYTSRYALEHKTLAHARRISPDKYNIGLGQYMMSVPPPGEDIVTMGANAGLVALQGVDVNDIDMLLFATESGIDDSKAAGTYVHDLLNLNERCRVVELKQACYAGTAAMQLSLSYIKAYPQKKVLVIASDIARYGLETSGESSQGAGAIAMVLSANPHLIQIEPEFGVMTENVMDFWRPPYLKHALVDGKASSKLYLNMLEKSWLQYEGLSNRHIRDHARFCYHVPVPRLVEKAHQHLLSVTGYDHLLEEESATHIQAGLDYGRQMGNSYTAALYVALASMLETTKEDLAGKRIGFYSYGSGCVAEYFSGVVSAQYRDHLHTQYHADLLAKRKSLTYEEYVNFYEFAYVQDGSLQDIPVYDTGHFRLAKIHQHKRIYEKAATATVIPFASRPEAFAQGLS